MNLDRIVQVLKKVNALVENLDDQGQTSAIERDLLLRYLRDLYEHVSDPGAGTEVRSAKKSATTALKSNHVPSAVETVQEFVPPAEVKPEPPREPVFSKDEQTTYYDAESSELPAAAEIPEPAAEVLPEEAAPKYFPPIDDSASSVEASRLKIEEDTDVAVSAVIDESRFAAVFSERNATDLADKFKLQRIQSIESEMGINQRLQTINELFEGDHSAFVDTLKQLNGVSDFTQAKRLLIKGPADRFSWDDDQKVKLAGDFVELVRRKFV